MGLDDVQRAMLGSIAVALILTGAIVERPNEMLKNGSGVASATNDSECAASATMARPSPGSLDKRNQLKRGTTTPSEKLLLGLIAMYFPLT